MIENEMKNDIKIPRLIFSNLNDLYKYFDHANMSLLIDIYEGIKFGVDTELDEVNIFEVQQEGSDNVLAFILHEKNWIKNLEIVIEKLIILEQYEKAGLVSELIKTIKNKQL